MDTYLDDIESINITLQMMIQSPKNIFFYVDEGKQ